MTTETRAPNALADPCRALGAPLALLAALALALTLPWPAAAQSGDATPAVRSAVGAYLAGRVAQERNDVAGAARYTAQALDRLPQDSALTSRAFLLHLAAGNMELALDLAPEIIEGQPHNLIARILTAARDVRRDAFAPALDALARADSENIGQYILPVLTGWALAGAGDIEAAMAALEPLTDVPGMESVANLHIGLIWDHAGEMEKARGAFETALAGGQNYRVIQALGRLYERAGEAENATVLYDSYNGQDGDRALLAPEARRARGDVPPVGPLFDHPAQGMAEALADLASLWQRESASDSALIYAQLSRYLSPSHERSTVLVADILAQRERYGEALDIYREIPADSAFSWSARLNEARMLDRSGDADAAVSLLNTMAREQPEATDPLVRIGDIQRSQRHFAEAVEAYDRAYARDSDLLGGDWAFLYRRGIALERAKQWERAEQDLLAAIELRPDYAHLLNYLGYSYIDRGEMVQESERLIRKAIDLQPEDGFIIDSLGWVYYRTARFEKAVEMLEKAVEFEPDDPTINDHLGDAYWMVGRKKEAVFQWRRALDDVEEDEDELRASLEAKLADGLVEHGVLAEFADGLDVQDPATR